MKGLVEKIFFSLIRYIINGEELSGDAKKLISPETMPLLYRLSKLHDLAHLIGTALSKLGVDCSENVLQEFEKEKMIAIFRHERLTFDYEALCDTLEKNSIPFIPLKGLIIRELYPEPWMRTSCDMDVLVKKEDAYHAIDCLCDQCGCSRDKDFTNHDYVLTSQSGMTIELHYSLISDGAIPKSNEILDSVWSNIDDKSSVGYKKAITGEFFVFYHIVHMAKHFLNGGCGIRPFVDLFLINKKMEYDHSALQELLKTAELEKFYDAVCSLVKVWFEGEEHSHITNEIEQFVLFGGVYGNVQNSAKVQAAKGKKKSKTLWSLIFLPRRNLEIIYPNLKKRPWLLPFYQVKRWFKVFRKASRQRAGSIIKASNSVSVNEADLTKKFLDEIGLN